MQGLRLWRARLGICRKVKAKARRATAFRLDANIPAGGIPHLPQGRRVDQRP